MTKPLVRILFSPLNIIAMQSEKLENGKFLEFALFRSLLTSCLRMNLVEVY